MGEELLTPGQAARRLGISDRTLAKLRRRPNRPLPSVRVGCQWKYPSGALCAWLAGEPGSYVQELPEDAPIATLVESIRAAFAMNHGAGLVPLSTAMRLCDEIDLLEQGVA